MQAMGSNAVAERRRVEAVVETLAAIHNHGESLVELAHDARNMVTALSLYCDLLEEPGVLPEAHRHYGSELRLVAEASRSLVEKLALLDEREEPSRRQSPDSPFQGQSFRDAPATERRDAATGPEPIPHWPIDDLLIHDFQDEVLASRNVLAAIAGPSIAVTVEADGGALPVGMMSEDLIRVLVNLVKNAAEGMAGAGTIRLAVTERKVGSGEASTVVLAVEDTGPGIPEECWIEYLNPAARLAPRRHRARGGRQGAAAGWGWPSPVASWRRPEARSVPETGPGTEHGS